MNENKKLITIEAKEQGVVLGLNYEDDVDQELSGTKTNMEVKLKEVLKSLRKEKGLTQVQLANELQIPYRTYTNYETGQRKISIDVLFKLENYYKISISAILHNFSRNEKSDLDYQSLLETFSDTIVDMKTLERLININTNIFCETNYIYLDYGANIKGYTLVSQKPSRYQMLNFKELDLLKDNKFTLKMALILIDNIKNRGW